MEYNVWRLVYLTILVQFVPSVNGVTSFEYRVIILFSDESCKWLCVLDELLEKAQKTLQNIECILFDKKISTICTAVLLQHRTLLLCCEELIL